MPDTGRPRSRLAWMGAFAAASLVAVGFAWPRPAAPTIDAAIDLVVREYLEQEGWDEPGVLPDGQVPLVYVGAEGASLDGLAQGWRGDGLSVDVSPYLADMPQGKGVVWVRHDTRDTEPGSVTLLVSSGEPGSCWRTQTWTVESSLFGPSATLTDTLMSCQ